MIIRRIIWFILFILALIGITYYGGPISYGFLSMVIMVPLISMFYLLCVSICFKIYQRKEVNRPMVGQAVPFHFKLMNEFFFAFSGIRVKFFTSFSSIKGLDDEAEYELIPGKGIDMDTILVCKYRGDYEVGIKTVEIQDFFRLFRFSYHNPETMRVEVIPRIVMLDSIKCMDQLNLLKEAKSQNSDPDVLVREYVAGDDVRQINWKVTSHVGQLMVRKQIAEEKQGICIILDTKKYSDNQMEYLPIENKMMETAIALSYYFAGKQTPVTVWTGNEKVQKHFVNRLEVFDDFYESMCAVSFSKGENAIGGKDDMGHVKSQNIYDILSMEGQLHECSMVFMIMQEQSYEAERLTTLLEASNVFVELCVVNNQNDDGIKHINSNRDNMVHIHMDSDLTEVL